MIEFGPFRYDAESRSLYHDDREIMLPPRVLAVLESLLKRPGKVVAKGAVLESAWDGAFVGEDSLTQAVSQLRKALGDDAQRPRYIQTIPKRGYRFIAAVSEPLTSRGPVPAPVEEPDAPSAAPVNVRRPPPVGKRAVGAGTVVGSYELISRIGAGAMGEVWRARDTTLQREVAIKVVPRELAGEAAVIERFRREALILAAVSHPNIATIHGIEEIDGTRFIVMELLDGETLQERLEAGLLPIEDALKIAIQIARALEVAHDAGIIHRDLKPGNIMLGAGNHAKVLDFGLAKDVEAEDCSETVDPTLLTAAGLLVGTAAYMSPEQAAGKPIDKRCDIFSFGCVVFEMLAGQRPFAGDTASEMVAAILKDAPDWSPLPDSTPADVRLLLRRCLRKDPDRRLHHIADARIAIEEALVQPDGETSGAASADTPSPRRSSAVPWAVAGLMAVVAAVAVWTGVGGAPPSRPVSRFTLDVPLVGISGTAVLVAPDGESLVLALGTPDDYQLYRRRLDHIQETAIPGTEGATLPFFSPDSQSLGFVPAPGNDGLATDSQLRQVPMNGGPSALITGFPGGRGADWAGNSIWFNPSTDSGIYRVAAVGGPVRELTKVDPAEKEFAHYWPHVLPDGQSFLFTSWKGSVTASEVVAYSPQTGQRKALVAGTNGKYAPSGHLVFVQNASLMAVAFDVETLEVIGDPVTVIESVYVRGQGAASYSFSETGTLAYVPDPEKISTPRRLVWVDRDGNAEPASALTAAFGPPRLSPDGTRVAVRIDREKVHILNLGSDSLELLSPETGSETTPVWSPDGDWIAFARETVHPDGVLADHTAAGLYDIYRRRSDFSEPAEPVLVVERGQFPLAWARGGEIAYAELMGVFSYDIRWIGGDAPGSGDFVSGPASEFGVSVSPDGEWAAYTSNESGAPEVYVEPFPGGGERTLVSNSGGRGPLWSPAGGEIFYRSGDRMMVVEVSTDSGFRAGPPRMLFEKSLPGEFEERERGYDVSADGQRFLMVEEIDRQRAPSSVKVMVVLNWFEELKERVPTGGR